MMSSDFSRNLTKYRKRCSLTQSQLAAQLNVTPQAVSKWENGSLPDPARKVSSVEKSSSAQSR